MRLCLYFVVILNAVVIELSDWFLVFWAGFLEKEIKRDSIKIVDTGDNPDAPATREMSDIEVTNKTSIC